MISTIKVNKQEIIYIIIGVLFSILIAIGAAVAFKSFGMKNSNDVSTQKMSNEEKNNANLLFEQAQKLINNGNLVDAKIKLREARELYVKTGDISRISEIDSQLSAIDAGILAPQKTNKQAPPATIGADSQFILKYTFRI